MNPRRSHLLDPRIVWMVLVAFTCLSLLPVDAGAALVESRLATGVAVSERAEQIETIRSVLETELVRQRLADYGLTAEEIGARLPELDDEQLHQLAALSDRLAEGGVLGAIIVILVVVLLVVLILRVSGKEVIVR
jgi:hypothetical protein